MSRANPTWGAPRIHGELLILGMNIGETSVSKYMDRHRKPPSQTGMFLTPFCSGDDPVGIAFTDSSTPASVTLRPTILRTPRLSAGKRRLDRWFDRMPFLLRNLGPSGRPA